MDLASTEIIQDFSLSVEGAALTTLCTGGNKAYRSAAFAILKDPAVDCPVSFVITTDETVSPDSGVLRGAQVQDSLYFYS